MKIILVGIVTFCMILVVAQNGSARSVTSVGDVFIETVNGKIHCDTMVCPSGSQSCHVTKRNDPKDFSQIVRKRTCYGSNGAILKEQTVYEPNAYGNHVNVNVVSGGGGYSVGRELTPEEEKELQETLRNTEREIKEQVDAGLRDLETNLAPFHDGSFARDLKNLIRFDKNFPF